MEQAEQEFGAAEEEEATVVVEEEDDGESEGEGEGDYEGEKRRSGNPLCDGIGKGGGGEECLPAGRPKCKYGMDCYRQ